MRYFTDKAAALTKQQYDELLTGFIKHQFFLPKDIIEAATPNYEIEPLLVLTGPAASNYLATFVREADCSEVEIRGNFDRFLLHLADKVGISVRKDYTTDIAYIVFKLWTPFEQPNTNRDKDTTS